MVLVVIGRQYERKRATGLPTRPPRCFEASWSRHALVTPLSSGLLNLPHAKTHLDTTRHAR
jgi:hypothetical protein